MITKDGLREVCDWCGEHYAYIGFYESPKSAATNLPYPVPPYRCACETHLGDLEATKPLQIKAWASFPVEDVHKTSTSGITAL